MLPVNVIADVAVGLVGVSSQAARTSSAAKAAEQDSDRMRDHLQGGYQT